MRCTTPRLLFALAVAMSVATTLHAQIAPNQGPVQPAAPTPSIQLTMADEHVLKEGLLKDNEVKPEATPVELERGTKVPAKVQLHAFPEAIASKIPTIRSHEYFITGNSVVIVEPQQRTIVEVVD